MVTPSDPPPAPRPDGRRDAHTGHRYVTRSDGAPPLPPPGGYRGARRVPTPTGPSAETVPGTPPRRRPGPLGWIALGGSAAFALALLVLLALGATDALYGATIVALQLVVAGVIVAALLTVRGRPLGAAALAVALLLNVGTVGALSAVRTSAEGGYASGRTAEQRHLEAFPGIEGEPATETLARPSLEEVRETADRLSREIRERLSAEYGVSWTAAPAEDIRLERNGYGGESMLVRFTSTTWSTNEPVSGTERKTAMLRTVGDVLSSHDWWDMIAFNDPASGLEPAIRERFYGSADLDEQVAWEWYTEDPSGEIAVYATVTDLANDTTGEWRTDRETQSARTGEPIEGLQISFSAERLLSEADRDEFERRMAEYGG
ncbi:hypothetical protein [Microbacterium sp. JZ31]|uniref:hypothetical protein n=1 Tax=Microbacterium sp. JZ31 TaxID=1906274 RepID=UPI001EE41C49|nr:hypothetical protein [Microbacterium sp. JZ31]